MGLALLGHDSAFLEQILVSDLCFVSVASWLYTTVQNFASFACVFSFKCSFCFFNYRNLVFIDKVIKIVIQKMRMSMYCP